MAVTGIGKCFARGIRSGALTLIEIKEKYVQDTKDSYLELYCEPIEE